MNSNQKSIRFKVEQKHIDQADNIRVTGLNNWEEYCPVTQSISEMFPNTHVVTGVQYVSIDDMKFVLSKASRKFVYMWDTGKPVHPQSFRARRII